MWAGEVLTREQRVLLSTNTSCGWLTGGGRGMNVGDIVRVLPNVRPDRFAGKTGTVCEVNDNEIAVDFRRRQRGSGFISTSLRQFCCNKIVRRHGDATSQWQKLSNYAGN